MSEQNRFNRDALLTPTNTSFINFIVQWLHTTKKRIHQIVPTKQITTTPHDKKTHPSNCTNKTDHNALLITTVIIVLNKWYVFEWVIIRFIGITPYRSSPSSLPPRSPVHALPFYSMTSIRIPWTCGCIVSFDTTCATWSHSNYFHSPSVRLRLYVLVLGRSAPDALWLPYLLVPRPLVCDIGGSKSVIWDPHVSSTLPSAAPVLHPTPAPALATLVGIVSMSSFSDVPLI
jgi:hypothetical protein